MLPASTPPAPLALTAIAVRAVELLGSGPVGEVLGDLFVVGGGRGGEGEQGEQQGTERKPSPRDRLRL